MQQGERVDLVWPKALLRRNSPAWMDKGLCGTVYQGFGDWWFPQAPMRDRLQQARYDREVTRAQRICLECPVRQECLEDAESRNERHGIWGGKNFYQPKQREQVAS